MQLLFLIHDQQYGENDECQKKRKVSPDAEHMPLFVVAVTDETLCLKVHGSLVKVNSTELAISEPTVTGL